MIAHAQRLPRRGGRPIQAAQTKRPVSARAKAKRLEMLRERRQRLFDRPIDYIPCREFLKANAEQRASVPPADAATPLERRSPEAAAPAGLTPYLASLYQTRLLSKDEEQFYFRRMN